MLSSDKQKKQLKIYVHVSFLSASASPPPPPLSLQSIILPPPPPRPSIKGIKLALSRSFAHFPVVEGGKIKVKLPTCVSSTVNYILNFHVSFVLTERCLITRHAIFPEVKAIYRIIVTMRPWSKPFKVITMRPG